jgi:hypothetical protein
VQYREVTYKQNRIVRCIFCWTVHAALDVVRVLEPPCAALQLLDLEPNTLYLSSHSDMSLTMLSAYRTILAGARGVDLLCDARHSLDLDQAEMQSPNEKNGSAKTECARK